jgi:hypothetical protein
MTDCSQYTLYSGGLKGAESEFGQNAEKWGIQEVTLSYEGHNVERRKGITILNEEELQKGDVSMEIVSKRMGRTYTESEKIRKVIQSLFHMINNGYQVFVVGWIMPDDTVKGGTGWGVELAKLFNRPLSVFDQERKEWFTWKDNKWVSDTPLISHKTFAGTGTRFLSDDGKSAIEDLFKRSFSP